VCRKKGKEYLFVVVVFIVLKKSQRLGVITREKTWPTSHALLTMREK
jgi:hypothetical protein